MKGAHKDLDLAIEEESARDDSKNMQRAYCRETRL
jgi:hypothetical protein